MKFIEKDIPSWSVSKHFLVNRWETNPFLPFLVLEISSWAGLN
jgi:hypothetical protein